MKPLNFDQWRELHPRLDKRKYKSYLKQFSRGGTMGMFDSLKEKKKEEENPIVELELLKKERDSVRQNIREAAALEQKREDGSGDEIIFKQMDSVCEPGGLLDKALLMLDKFYAVGGDAIVSQNKEKEKKQKRIAAIKGKY